jgi:hypothetical protein
MDHCLTGYWSTGDSGHDEKWHQRPPRASTSNLWVPERLTTPIPDTHEHGIPAALLDAVSGRSEVERCNGAAEAIMAAARFVRYGPMWVWVTWATTIGSEGESCPRPYTQDTILGCCTEAEISGERQREVGAVRVDRPAWPWRTGPSQEWRCPVGPPTKESAVSAALSRVNKKWAARWS